MGHMLLVMHLGVLLCTLLALPPCQPEGPHAYIRITCGARNAGTGSPITFRHVASHIAIYDVRRVIQAMFRVPVMEDIGASP